MDISGKTAIVTGAASGIGLGIATALAEAGAKSSGLTSKKTRQSKRPTGFSARTSVSCRCAVPANVIKARHRRIEEAMNSPWVTHY